MWHGILGHDDVVERFRRSLARDRLASTFLFVGPLGVGKKTFALKFAQALLCQARPVADLDPCETCPACMQVKAHTHPDLQLIAKPADKSTIPLAAFVGDDNHRMSQGLCHDIALKPFMGGRKVAIIDDADALNEEGANCLLKTLEEPPPKSALILIGTSPEQQLPTIRSRCQIIRFRPLADEIVAELLLKHELVDNAEEARRLAQFSGGSLARAADLADPELWKFRQQLLSELAKPQLQSVALGRALNEFVDQAGKEASARRDRSRTVIGFAIEFYRQLLRVLAGMPAAGDMELARAVERAAAAWQGGAAAIMARLDRSLETLSYIDRNANQTTLLEAWTDGLARESAE